MDYYIQWVSHSPLFSAAIQFAILGTLGELLPHWLGAKKLSLPCTVVQLLGKVLSWALLGLIIKYGFTGMKGFTRSLIDASLLPSGLASGLGWAFTLSVLTNLFFGPQMMFLHRLEDNLILRQRGFDGLTTAWWTLLWFWIPAHTITFILPKEYQIGLAALWSVVLGVIMGFTKKRSLVSQDPAVPVH